MTRVIEGHDLGIVIRTGGTRFKARSTYNINPDTALGYRSLLV